MSRFKEQHLGDVLDFFDHQRVPLSSLERETRQGEYRYYGAQGVIDHLDSYIFDGQYILIAEDGANLTTRKEPIAFLVDGQFWVNNHAHVVRGKPGLADNFYLVSLLNSQNILGYITGVAQPKLSQQNLRQIKVRLPDFDTQRRITGVLSAYDDLMENNRRRMELLEETARLLYREWFVRLRFPGHERTKITRGLPEGWTRTPLQEVAEFRLGKMLDQQKNRGDLLPYLANVNVRWGQIELRDLREMPFEHGELETFGLKFGDIVMCEGGEPGRCAIWKDQVPGMMIQKAIHRIRCRESMDFTYLYQSLRHQAEAGQLATLFTGATIKHLPREKLAKVMIVVPPARLLSVFSAQARLIENQLALLEAANRRALAARDLLLPRLMSGEIAV